MATSNCSWLGLMSDSKWRPPPEKAVFRHPVSESPDDQPGRREAIPVGLIAFGDLGKTTKRIRVAGFWWAGEILKRETRGNRRGYRRYRGNSGIRIGTTGIVENRQRIRLNYPMFLKVRRLPSPKTLSVMRRLCLGDSRSPPDKVFGRASSRSPHVPSPLGRLRRHWNEVRLDYRCVGVFRRSEQRRCRPVLEEE